MAGKHICETCGMEFLRKWNLSRHQRVAHGACEITCEDCGERFQRPWAYKRHQREVHGGVGKNTHSCSACGAVFTAKRNLTQYERLQHTDGSVRPPVYSCDKCDLVFQRISTLRRHQRLKHSDKPGEKPGDQRPPTLPAPMVVEGNRSGEIGDTQMDNFGSTSLSEADAKVSHVKIAAVAQEMIEVDGTERFDADPVKPPEEWLPTDPERRGLYVRHWSSIRQHFHRGRLVQDIYNYRLSSIESLDQYIEDIFDDQSLTFLLNYSFGYILKHKETGQLRYFYASTNNERVLPQPHRVDSRAAVDRLLSDISTTDPLQWAHEQRPNTKWIVDSITNVQFHVHKVPNQPLGGPVKLPDYLQQNRGLYSLVIGAHGPYKDHLCLFRCLAVHLDKCQPKACDRKAKVYYEQYRTAMELENKHFRGVPMRHFDAVEDLFQVNIQVYQLGKQNDVYAAKLTRRSIGRHSTTMRLNMYGAHLSYIKDLALYAQSYACDVCGKVFPTQHRLRRHQQTCDGLVQRKYPGGVFRNQPTIFEELEDMGIVVPETERIFPYRACYDFEACLEKPVTDVPNSATTEWTALHRPMSVSVNSNVPEFDTAVCFVSTGDADKLVRDMLNYLHDISLASYERLTEHYAYVLNQLDERIPTVTGDQPKPKRTPYTQKVKGKFLDYLMQLPVLGFNSGNYDMNLIKRQLYPYLAETNDMKYVIKRNNNHMALVTEHLRFLDVRNYLAPNYSYDKWIKAYDCQHTKGKFCYAYIDNLTRLEETALPPREAFDNDLKNEPCTEEEYDALKAVWREGDMKTLKDFLIWYNNLDVIPFMEAAAKMVNFYRGMNVDVFKDCISIPGLTLRYLFHQLPTVFSLISEEDKDMHDCLKKNIVGGPSIIFHRYHEKGVTRIRDGKLCQQIIGFDANALYLSCLSQPMPSGHYVRWKPCDDTHFSAQRAKGMTPGLAEKWLDWMSQRLGVNIRHRLNHTEKRIGDRRLPVDGFAYIDGRPTVLQFHGCYFHFHNCYLNHGSDGELRYNTKRGLEPEELQNEVDENRAYIESLGYDYIEIWECEFYQLRRTDDDLRAFLRSYSSTRRQKPCTMDQLLNRVLNDDIFGFVECDIHVPDTLKQTFAECPPIFKNTNVSIDDIGPTMQTFAKANGILSQPRRMLIGSMFGEKILLATPLLKWYLNHGLEVTRVYQVMQYTPNECFKSFAEEVTEARRQGDVDPSKALIGETMKLLGNSAYGKTVTNQDKHTQVDICDLKKTRKLVPSALCRTIHEIDEGTYEVVSLKKTIKYNLPLQIGCMVYQYAKLRMLEFYFDFIAKYFDPADWQYCEMDTDSAYMAWSDPDWESLVKPELRSAYEAERDKWLPRPDHYDYDKRTPGLFKVEWSGDAIVSLCSKTYYCYGGEGNSKDKLSCKGVSSRNIDKDVYLSVLRTHQSAKGVNRGMRMKDGDMRSYTQYKSAFTYFYPKRKVLEDGITTTYLDI